MDLSANARLKFRSQTSLHELWAAWALITVAFLVYFQVAHFGFLLLDDRQTVCTNPLIVHPTLNALREIWSRDQASLYIPVTYSAWWVIAHVSLSAKVFHAAVLGLHAATAAVLFCVGRIALPRTPLLALFMPVALWTLHPLNVDAVAWISGLKDVLCILFLLLSLTCLLRHSQATSGSATGWLMSAIVLAIAAVLSKPTAAAIALAGPFLLLATGGRAAIKSSIAVLISYATIAGATAVITLRVQPPASVISLSQRLLLTLDGLGWYAVKTIWPSGLSVDPGRTPAAVAANYGYVAAGVMVLAATAALLMRAKTRRIGWLVVAGLAIWLPVSGIVPFEFQRISNTSGRYAYGPLAFIALAVAGAMPPRKIAIFSAIPFVIGAALITAFHTATYTDSPTLLNRALEQNPASWMARNGLAELAMGRSDWLAARSLSEDSLAVNPDQPEARVTLAAALARLGESGRALTLLRASSAKYGSDPSFAAALGTLEAREGNLGEARIWLERALRGDPWQKDALVNLGTLKAQSGDYPAAAELLTRATQADPASPIGWRNLGFVKQAQHEIPAARAAFEQTLRLDPGDSEVRMALSTLPAGK